MSATEVDGWDGEWVAAPIDRRCVWGRRLEPLRENPGEWARFGPYAFGVGKQVGHIRRGKYGEGFVVERHVEAHQEWIYVKFEEDE